MFNCWVGIFGSTGTSRKKKLAASLHKKLAGRRGRHEREVASLYKKVGSLYKKLGGWIAAGARSAPEELLILLMKSSKIKQNRYKCGQAGRLARQARLRGASVKKTGQVYIKKLASQRQRRRPEKSRKVYIKNWRRRKWRNSEARQFFSDLLLYLRGPTSKCE